jgi:hypothetical protein
MNVVFSWSSSSHCDVVVPGVAVEEAEQVAARRGVDDLVYTRQPEGVLGAVLVEVGVVDAHPPLVQVLLADEDGVSDVVWTSLGPLPRWVPGPTTQWAPGTTQLALYGT